MHFILIFNTERILWGFAGGKGCRPLPTIFLLTTEVQNQGLPGQHKPEPTQMSLSGSCPAAVAISAQGRMEALLWFSVPVSTMQGVFARAVLFPPRMLMLFLWHIGVYGDGLCAAHPCYRGGLLADKFELLPPCKSE